MAATLLPSAELQFCDSNGKPLAGGKVYFYIPNTTTPKNTWQDPQQTILNPNPVVLDAAGRAIIWGAGIYRQQVYDQFGNLIWDQITEDTSGGLLGNMTDDIFVAGTDFTPGITTKLTLTVSPGAVNNTWIYFDGVYQDDTQSSLSGTTLTFTSPIPVGVGKVTVKIGNTLTIGSPSDGTVTDASVATNAGINSSKLSFLFPAAGAISRTVLSRLSDVVNVKDFGAVGDGATDDTAAFNAAITYCTTNGVPLYVPSTQHAYVLTSTIVITNSLTMYGDGTCPYANTQNQYTTTATRGPGSWIYINHAGVGFSATSSNTSISTFFTTYKGIGTVRNQPTPNGAATWAPAANGFDFQNDGVDLIMDDVVGLNPTKFASTTGGTRAWYNNVRGQPLQQGILTDTAYDVCRYENIHFWPFWSIAPGVISYMTQNAVAFYSFRNDNPFISNFFAFGYFNGIQVAVNANGVTSLMQGVNIGFDNCQYGLYVVGSTTMNNVFTGSFTNMYVNGTGLTSGSGIVFDANTIAGNVRIDNLKIQTQGGAAIFYAGHANLLHLGGNISIDTWGMNNNVPAIQNSGLSHLYLANVPQILGYKTPGGAGGVLLATNALVHGVLGRGQGSATTNASGQIAISHNLGVAPPGVIAGNMTTAATPCTISAPYNQIDSSGFVLNFAQPNGSPLANTAVNYSYDLVAA